MVDGNGVGHPRIRFQQGVLVPSGYLPSLTFELSEAAMIQPAFWAAPPGDHYENLLYGGGSVPWDLWANPIAFWFTFNMAFQMMLFMAALPKKQWVDTEDLVFLFGMAAANLIDTGVKEGNKPLTDFAKNKWIWVGVILGFVTTMPRLITVLWPPLGIAGASYAIDLPQHCCSGCCQWPL